MGGWFWGCLVEFRKISRVITYQSRLKKPHSSSFPPDGLKGISGGLFQKDLISFQQGRDFLFPLVQNGQ
jgi:hypothetical protein